jgi:hypothetical protein
VICVFVGFNGTEERFSVLPTEHISEFKSKVTAATGKRGKLFHLEDGAELFDDHTISACISDCSSVQFVINDSFTSEKEVLLALRNSLTWKAKRSWRPSDVDYISS